MSVFYLDKNEIAFPDPTLAEDNGLLAVGGDLSVDRLVLAYSNGIFPWYDKGEPVLWWCPKKRFIIEPKEIHISHSMKKYMRKHEISYTLNRDFAHTMHRCRTKREFKEGTWIDDAMEEAYYALWERRLALSLEAWVDGRLAGGLYGVCLGRCFFGESMYSEQENGSKLALIMLAGLLENNAFVMIDCQFYTKHLESMGGREISWEEYKSLLNKGLALNP